MRSPHDPERAESDPLCDKCGRFTDDEDLDFEPSGRSDHMWCSDCVIDWYAGSSSQVEVVHSIFREYCCQPIPTREEVKAWAGHPVNCPACMTLANRAPVSFETLTNMNNDDYFDSAVLEYADTSCPECWGTGFTSGFSGACTRGCVG